MKTGFKRKLADGLFGLSLVAGSLIYSGIVSAQDLSTSTSTVHNGLLNMPNVVTGACYILGAGILGAGLLKLKMYAEAPGQTPLSHGLGRVCVGALLVGAPALTGWLQTSLGSSGSPVASVSMGTIQ
jgi:hypothetical protein